MKVLLTLLLFLSHQKSNCLKLDVILLGDMSGSVGGNERFVASAFTSFVSKFDFDEDNLQIGAFIFNDRAIKISPLTSDKASLVQNILSINSTTANGSTFLYPALNAVVNEFSTNGIKSHRKIIILVSDGAVDDLNYSLGLAQTLRDFGIQIFGVLILDGSNKPDFMIKISDQYFETDYEKLGETMKKMDMCL